MLDRGYEDVRESFRNRERKMKLPKIGDNITAKEALELCRYFDLNYLVERIESDPESYKDWKFDGCSGLRMN